MAHIDDHCKDTKYFIDDWCDDIHRFLDQYAGVFDIRMFQDYHRTFLHNTYGYKVCTARWGKRGRIGAMLHLVRDYCGGTITHWSLDKIEKDFPKYLIWFDLLRTSYTPLPHVEYAWEQGKKGLVAIAYPKEN